jgi:hypothetical protein
MWVIKMEDRWDGINDPEQHENMLYKPKDDQDPDDQRNYQLSQE